MSTKKRDSPRATETGPQVNRSQLSPDAQMERQEDSSPQLVATNDAGQLVIRYLHGPHFRDELQRLGITTNLVRFRETPLFRPDWTPELHPPELTKYWNVPIPVELRGRTGTLAVDPLRWLDKYTVSAFVRLHRPAKGPPGVAREAREKVEVPLVWLEGAP